MTDTIGRDSADISADTRPASRPTPPADTRPKSRSSIDRHYRPSLRQISAEYWSWPTLSANTRPITSPILDRHLHRPYRSTVGRNLGPVLTLSAEGISVDTRPTLSALTRSKSRSSMDHDRHYRPTLSRYLCRYSTDISADTQPKSRSSFDRHYRPTLGRYLGRHSTDISADTIGRHSAEILVQCWPTLTVLADTRSSIDRHYRPTPRRYLGRHSTDISTSRHFNGNLPTSPLHAALEALLLTSKYRLQDV